MVKKPLLSLITALGENRIIGNQGKIPWHIKADLVRFKNKTIGHVVVMGRKTFDSLKRYYQKSGNPMPKRIHIIVTRNREYKVNLPDCYIVNSIEKALELGRKMEKEEIFVSGGGQIYQQTIDLADKLYLTIVKGNFKGDAYFPKYKNKGFKTIKEEEKKEGKYIFKFVDLERL